MRMLSIMAATICLAVVLTGCITISQYRFTCDFGTGEVRREYYDLTSRPGLDDKDYNVTNDWAALKGLIAERKPEFDPEVVADVSKVLFEEDAVLCARKIQRVKCPKCFPSKAAVLAHVHDKDWRFELINDEIVLFLPAGKRVISTNGEKVATPKNSLIFWPQETNRIEYVVSEPASGGTSLLPFYRQEQKKPRDAAGAQP